MKNSKMSMIRQFVKDIDNDYRVRVGSNFEVDISEEKVFITFRKDKELDKMFNDFLQKEFGIRVNLFLISLLHEIGHIETYDDELDETRSIVYSMLKVQFEEDGSSIEEYNNMYFRIPAEYNATSWAVQYYLENKEKCDELVERLGV